VQTNQAFLRAALDHPAFQAGATDTDFLARHFAGWREPAGDLPLALIAATLAQWVQHPRPDAGGYWRNNPGQPQVYRYVVASRADPVEVRLAPLRKAGSFQVGVALEPEIMAIVELDEILPPHPPALLRLGSGQASPSMGEGEIHDLTLAIDGRRQQVALASAGETWWVQTRDGVARLRALARLPMPHPPADAGGSLRAPMPGKVLAVLVRPGQPVAQGDALLKLEAMKMEHTIRTAAAGVVEAIYFGPGDTVDADALLVKIREES
jgi:acetyl/propionyl-CoA carboxylase alpha subunit